MNVANVITPGWRPVQDLTGRASPCRTTQTDYDDGNTVDHPVLYDQQAHDADAVNMGDITQGHLADCFLLATLGAIARTPQGPAFIRQSIVENRGPDGSAASYTVTLHHEDSLASLFGRTRFTDMKVTVTASTFGHVHAKARPDGQSGENEIWPLVYERAYLQATGGAEAVIRTGGGSVGEAMEMVTGKAVMRSSPGSSGLADKIETAIKNGGLVVVSTQDDKAQAQPLVERHAYVVTLTTRSPDGQLWVQLHNPHNDVPDPPPMPYDDLVPHAKSVAIGSLP
jgi:hypothetical protein